MMKTLFVARTTSARAIFAVCAVLLTGCGGATVDNAAGDVAAAVVEQYLTAKANGDEAGIRANLCAAMEADIQREVSSFSAVTGVSIDNMECARDSSGDTVTCTGAIVAEYGAENTTFPLRTYRVVQEDGEYKWCGEAPAAGA